MKFILVEWPETQNLMDHEGFEENACLANDDYFLKTYGSSAYFVNEEWLKEVEDGRR